MKLLMAFVVWGLMAAALATGCVLAVKGNPWLLIGSATTMIVMIAKIGCLSHD